MIVWNEDKERAAFEKWAVTTYRYQKNHEQLKREGEYYKDYFFEALWRAWCARAREGEPLPDGPL